jgi:hypothetical protein
VRWLKEHSGSQEPTRWAHDKNKCSVGVAASEDTVEWIWNQHFAAVAGDALAWESVPYPADRPCKSFPPGLKLVTDIALPALHQHLIPMFGMPIGELWDLEELASMCERLGRYSFLVTSIPLHVPGGVASPPNAIAIF